jgi:hypothetical protein
MKAWSALALALGSAVGCATPYEVTRAPLGQPAAPEMRAAGVLTAKYVPDPGWAYEGRSHWGRRAVTPGGTERRDYSHGSFSHTVHIDVRVQAGPDGGSVGVVDMAWNEPSVPPCEGTNLATDLLVVRQGDPYWPVDARQIHWERPVVVRGERIVSGRFADDSTLPTLLLRPSVVDVHVVTPHGSEMRRSCVRVPVTGPDVDYRSMKTWAGGARVEWRSSLAFAPVEAIMVGASLARWVGPVRFGLHGMIGVGDDWTEDIVVGGLVAEVGGLAWRWTRWALGWSLGYEALFADLERNELPGQPRTRGASQGGPRLGLQVLRTSPEVMRVSRFSPTDAWGLELFVAAAQTWRGGDAGSPLTFGVALLAF